MFSFFLPPNAPAVIAEYHEARSAFENTAYAGSTYDWLGHFYARYARADCALAEALADRGGEWVIGDHRYRMTKRGIQVERILHREETQP